YAVMAIQFENFLFPFIIMFSMPATIIGIVFGLLVSGLSLSIPAFIGIIMLAGIVVNNSIVLVDYINILRRRGMERHEAIIEAGKSRLPSTHDDINNRSCDDPTRTRIRRRRRNATTTCSNNYIWTERIQYLYLTAHPNRIHIL